MDDDRADLLRAAARFREAPVAAHPGDGGALHRVGGVRQRRAREHAQERGDERGPTEHRAVVTQNAQRRDPASTLLYRRNGRVPGTIPGDTAAQDGRQVTDCYLPVRAAAAPRSALVTVCYKRTVLSRRR